MGTSLQGRGLGAGLPERWLLERPAEVEAVHRSHVEAGAEAVLTCTFNLAAPRLGSLRPEVPALASAAVAAARASGAALVWGAVGPTALVRPGDPVRPSSAALRGWYAPAFEALARAGADLLLAETQWDLDEALAALEAARATGLPAAATFTYGEGLALPSGPPALEALRALAEAGAALVGVSCVAADGALARLVAEAAGLGVPLLVKPSPGLPGALLAPRDFAARVAGLPAAWIGACCGGSAAHVAALRSALQSPRG